MVQLNSLDDTIVAISTAMGQGGIGIVRLSGKEALTVAQRMIVLKSKRKISGVSHATVHFGWVVDQLKGIIDEALITVMRGPKSYTREDVVEIGSHGSTVSLKAIVERALECGARTAEPGEFTKRAFLNGRIDLAQAEAVLDVIQSKTDSFLKISAHQLKGDLSNLLESIREGLMTIYVECEALVNFPEDEIDSQGIMKIDTDILNQRQRVTKLLSTSRNGIILKEGIKIVICGRPNVGKSSLLNVILKQPRAIVSDVAGTTRDSIEESAQIKGIPFQLVDTAGILDPRDMIEQEAVQRSHMHIQGADLVVFVLDASQKLTDEDNKIIKKLKGLNVLVVLNKSDLNRIIEMDVLNEIFVGRKIVSVSAKDKNGIEGLENAVVSIVTKGQEVNTHQITISNMRHVEALKNCEQVLFKCAASLSQGLSLEFVSEDIKAAVNYLDSITGRDVDSDLLDTIFSQFCIGK